MTVQNDPDIPINYRIDAAKNAAPYLHQKVPAIVEHSGKDGEPIEIQYADARNRLESFLLEGDYEEIDTLPDISDSLPQLTDDSKAKNLDELFSTIADDEAAEERTKRRKRRQKRSINNTADEVIETMGLTLNNSGK